jgi:hypothetical protein
MRGTSTGRFSASLSVGMMMLTWGSDIVNVDYRHDRPHVHT